MTRREEQQLIERAAAGDRQAAEACIRAHQQSLFAYLLRLSGRPEMAEDLVQEAFVRVLTNLDRFDPRFRFSTWLFTIAKRLYMNACQRLKPAYDSDVVGAAAGGPPCSAQRRRSIPPTTVQAIVTRPCGRDSAPYLMALVPSSCSIKAMCNAVCGSNCTTGPDAASRVSSTEPSNS